MFDDYDVDADYYTWALGSDFKEYLETIDEEPLPDGVGEKPVSIQYIRRYYERFRKRYNDVEEEEPKVFKKSKPDLYSVRDKIDDRFLNWNRDNAVIELKELQEENHFLKLKNNFLQRQCVTHILRVTNDFRKLEHTGGNRPLDDPEYQNMLEEFATDKLETERQLEKVSLERNHVESIFRVLEFSYEELSNVLMNKELHVIVALTRKQQDLSIDLPKVVQTKRNRWELLFQTQLTYVKLKQLFKTLKKELDMGTSTFSTEDFISLKRQFVTERDKFEKDEFASKVVLKQLITCETILNHMTERSEYSDCIIHGQELDLKYLESRYEAAYSRRTRANSRKVDVRNSLEITVDLAGLRVHEKLLWRMSNDLAKKDALLQRISLLREFVKK